MLMMINTKTNPYPFHIKTKISSKNKVLPIGIFLLLALGLASVNVIYAQTNSTQSSSVSNKQGTITSVKNGADHKPAWNIVGEWNATGLNSNNISFNAQFSMTKIDGSGKHNHTISNFHMTGNPITNATGTTYKGTITITLKAGPVNNVLTTLVISPKGNIAITIDPTTTGDHFGKKPIKGTTK